MTQNLKIKACFMQDIMELDMKKLLDPKAVKSGVWGLKTWYTWAQKTYHTITLETWL